MYNFSAQGSAAAPKHWIGTREIWTQALQRLSSGMLAPRRCFTRQHVTGWTGIWRADRSHVLDSSRRKCSVLCGSLSTACRRMARQRCAVHLSWFARGRRCSADVEELQRLSSAIKLVFFTFLPDSPINQHKHMRNDHDA